VTSVAYAEDDRGSLWHPANNGFPPQDIFAPFKIVSARETTLGANEWIHDNKRMVWRAESNDIENEFPTANEPPGSLNVTLNPMEIRTFIVEVAN